MENKVAILTSGHPPLDERIYWKFACSLSADNYNVSIISSSEEKKERKENVIIDSFNGNLLTKRKKIDVFYNHIREFQPRLIICCEPLVIISAHKYKKQFDKNCIIVSDITEYYPNKNTLKLYRGLRLILKYLQLFMFNIYATSLADYLIIGEREKARLYEYISPFKKKIIIGYYPPLSLFNFSPPKYDGKTLTLCYTGALNKERGFYRFSALLKKLADKNQKINITAKIVGTAPVEAQKELEELKLIPNMKIEHVNNVNYDLFSSEIHAADICIDLREKNKLFDNSLPIKIFDYMACGKPVIFSNLRSFYQFPEAGEVGFLVDPEDLNSVMQKIQLFIHAPDLLMQHSARARELAETKYNWESLAQKLLLFINNIFPDKKKG